MLLSGNNQQPNEENIMFFVSPLFGSSGNNFMTVNATGGGEITITPTSGLMTLAQNQISGISITSVVPESSSMLLVGSGLLLLALGLRRKLL
jgi:hypothetical protein